MCEHGRRRRLGGRLATAVMLGVGAIFQGQPDEHWSKSPKVEIAAEAESEAAGDPPTES